MNESQIINHQSSIINSLQTRPWLTVATMLLADIIALLLAGLVAIQLKVMISAEVPRLPLYRDLWPLMFLFPLVYAAVGLYSGLAVYPTVALGPAEELRRATLSSTIVFLGLAAATFLFRNPNDSSQYRDYAQYSRSIFLMAWVMTLVTVPLGRSMLRGLFAAKPWWGHPVMVLGAGKTAELVLQALRRQPGIGLKPIAVLDDDPAKHGELCGVPVIGGTDLAPKLAQQGVKCAIIAMPGVSGERLQELYDKYGSALPHLLIIPSLVGFTSLWVTAKDLGGIMGLEVRQQLLLTGPRATKRLLDLLLTAVGGLLIAPLLLLLALWIKLDSTGPVLFVQKRPGRHGRPFPIYKFRTMHADAARRLNELSPEQRAELEEFGKIKSDPRVTRAGRWLRRFSLDELPQLWNVLLGQMSLVGPRAYVKRQLSQMGRHRELIFKVRPGITGIWQISGRSELSFEQRLELDSYYVRNWSVWQDLYILAHTGWVVLFARGAY